MYNLRCTRPLLQRFEQLGARDEGPAQASTTALGDWYVNRLHVGRHRLVLCTSALSLLSVVVRAKEPAGLPGRLADSVAYLLGRLGLTSAVIRRELEEMTVVRVGRTQSRSVLGSMNDLAWMADGYIRDSAGPIVYLSEIDLRLSQTPCGPLQFANPAQVGTRLLASAT